MRRQHAYEFGGPQEFEQIPTRTDGHLPGVGQSPDSGRLDVHSSITRLAQRGNLRNLRVSMALSRVYTLSSRRMLAQKSMLSEFAWDQRYQVFLSSMTCLPPALLLYPEIVASNIERTLELLGGDANRWRVPHQDRKAELHASHADRSRHPQFQMRDHPRTASGLPQRCGRRTLRLSRGAAQVCGGSRK